jgi:hypothetical protein
MVDVFSGIVISALLTLVNCSEIQNLFKILEPQPGHLGCIDLGNMSIFVDTFLCEK